MNAVSAMFGDRFPQVRSEPEVACCRVGVGCGGDVKRDEMSLKWKVVAIPSVICMFYSAHVPVCLVTSYGLLV